MEINAAQKPSSFVKIFQDGDVKVKTCLLLINTAEKISMGNDIGEPNFLKYKNGGKQLIFDIFQVIKSLRFQNISQIARSRLDWPIRLEASLFDHLLLPDLTGAIFCNIYIKRLFVTSQFDFCHFFHLCDVFVPCQKFWMLWYQSFTSKWSFLFNKPL